MQIFVVIEFAYMATFQAPISNYSPTVIHRFDSTKLTTRRRHVVFTNGTVGDSREIDPILNDGRFVK